MNSHQRKRSDAGFVYLNKKYISGALTFRLAFSSLIRTVVKIIITQLKAKLFLTTN
jgi:hypothetical protein